MATKELNVIFTKNALNNIVLKDQNGHELVGFIRHTEYYLTNFYAFNLNVAPEEFQRTKKVFVYLRTKENFHKHLEELTTYVKQVFNEAEVVSSGEVVKNELHTIDIFLHE